MLAEYFLGATGISSSQCPLIDEKVRFDFVIAYDTYLYY
jgi:hypothetical protein